MSEPSDNSVLTVACSTLLAAVRSACSHRVYKLPEVQWPSSGWPVVFHDFRFVCSGAEQPVLTEHARARCEASQTLLVWNQSYSILFLSTVSQENTQISKCLQASNLAFWSFVIKELPILSPFTEDSVHFLTLTKLRLSPEHALKPTLREDYFLTSVVILF